MMRPIGRKGLIYPILAAILVFAAVSAIVTVISFYNAQIAKTEAETLAIQRGAAAAPLQVVTGGVPSEQCAGGTAVAVSAGGKDAITGAGADVNVALFTLDSPIDADSLDEEQTGETRANAAITSISTAFPVQRAAYAVIGNDDYQWTTDRGTDYYTRKWSFNSGCSALSLGFIPLYAESNITYTFYDDNSAESVPNITIGSGGSYVKASVKLEADDNEYIGSPDYYKPEQGIYPLGVCFNESTAGRFEYIKPKNYVSTFTRPKFLIGKQIVGDCYELGLDVVKDQGISPEIPLTFKANTGQDPAKDTAHMYVLDRCARISDNKVWEFGVWGDDSVEGTSYDCGIDAVKTVLQINFE